MSDTETITEPEVTEAPKAKAKKPKAEAKPKSVKPEKPAKATPVKPEKPAAKAKPKAEPAPKAEAAPKKEAKPKAEKPAKEPVTYPSAPWDGLGAVIAESQPKDMLRIAKLNWHVDKVIPTYTWTKRGSHEPQVMQGDRAYLIRSSDGRHLTTAGPNWEHLQNDESFKTACEIASKAGMSPYAAGQLRNGGMVWFMFKHDSKKLTLFKEDDIYAGMMITIAHEYGKAPDIRFTPIREASNTTLMMPCVDIVSDNLRAFNEDLAANIAGTLESSFDAYSVLAKLLADKPCSADAALAYCKAIYPPNETSASFKKDPNYITKPAKLIHDVLDTQHGAAYGKGTWWQAFNASLFALDYVIGESADTRLQTAWYTGQRERKLRALDIAVNCAKST